MYRFRKMIRRLLESSGYVFFSKEAIAASADQIAQANYLRNMLTALDIEVVLDVGANAGQFRDLLRHDAGFHGRIVSFEPLPHLVAELIPRSRLDKDWEVFGFALGDKAGELPLNVMQNSVFSSFLRPDQSQPNRFPAANEVTGSINVQVRTLDSLVPDTVNPGLSSVFLKLDTQGYDLNALRGAAGMLGSVRCVQTELSFLPIYSGMPSYREVMEYLVAHGFELAGIYRTNMFGYPTELLECDAYFVNTRYLPGGQ